MTAAHGKVFHGDAARGLPEPVGDRFARGGVRHGRQPLVHGHLPSDEGGAPLGAVFYNLKQVPLFLHSPCATGMVSRFREDVASPPAASSPQPGLPPRTPGRRLEPVANEDEPIRPRTDSFLSDWCSRNDDRPQNPRRAVGIARTRQLSGENISSHCS